jgi:4-cresol dehydrogenase (hydroxylating)
MNKILHVDPELCTALVEPGVTYQQLYDYIQEHQLPLMLSFSAPSAIAGPLGNTMDRGVGYTPMANTSDAVRHGSGAGQRRCAAPAWAA